MKPNEGPKEGAATEQGQPAALRPPQHRAAVGAPFGLPRGRRRHLPLVHELPLGERVGAPAGLGLPIRRPDDLGQDEQSQHQAHRVPRPLSAALQREHAARRQRIALSPAEGAQAPHLPERGVGSPTLPFAEARCSARQDRGDAAKWALCGALRPPAQPSKRLGLRRRPATVILPSVLPRPITHLI